jgi:hypothetical protein
VARRAGELAAQAPRDAGAEELAGLARRARALRPDRD